MLTYDEVKEAFPSSYDISPDRQLIIFAHKLGKKNFCIDNIAVVMGMLLYIISNGIRGYEKDYKMLEDIYEWLVNKVPYGDKK
ncbi:MAG: hypothetical protein RSE41_05215 [Clostridia bacterium]